MQTSASYARTFTQAINGSPAALAIPSDISVVEMRLQSTGSILVRTRSGDPDFTLATGQIHSLPINDAYARDLLVTNSATVDVLVLGNRK